MGRQHRASGQQFDRQARVQSSECEQTLDAVDGHAEPDRIRAGDARLRDADNVALGIDDDQLARVLRRLVRHCQKTHGRMLRSKARSQRSNTPGADDGESDVT